MSVSKDMQALREMLKVKTSAEVILKVAELQAGPPPEPDRYIVTVTWTDGAPTRTAQVNILQPQNAPIVKACDALQAGLAVLNLRLGSIAAQAVQRSEMLQKKLKEAKDAIKVDELGVPVPAPENPVPDADESA